MNYCSKCGAQLPAGATFCGACGSMTTQQGEGIQKPTGSVGSPIQIPRRGMKFKIIVGTLIAVILVAGGFWGWKNYGANSHGKPSVNIADDGIIAKKGEQPTDSQKDIPSGNDLRGGVHLVFQAEPDKVGKTITNDDMDKANTIITKRLNEMGALKPVVQTDYDKKQIVVDFAGIQDLDIAAEVIKTTAKLTFRDRQGNVVLEGDQISDAKASKGQSGGFVVSLNFTSEGTKKFADLTSKYIGQPIAIYLDDKLLINPTIYSTIANGQADITGYATMEAATDDAVLMRSGSLPVGLTIIEKRQIPR